MRFSSFSAESETHKRSKSILKNKSEARIGDPESERLLSDTGSGVSDISVILVSEQLDEAAKMIKSNPFRPKEA